MEAMKEVPKVRQIAGEPRRRWFCSRDLDLIVWLDQRDAPTGFQLCYDKAGRERALTWRPRYGYDHAAVDSGEYGGGQSKSTPILRPGGRFDRDRVKALFVAACGDVPGELCRYVEDLLDAWPGLQPTALWTELRPPRRRPWWKFWSPA